MAKYMKYTEEQMISFAKFAKNYSTPRKVEDAFEKFISQRNINCQLDEDTEKIMKAQAHSADAIKYSTMVPSMVTSSNISPYNMYCVVCGKPISCLIDKLPSCSNVCSDIYCHGASSSAVDIAMRNGFVQLDKYTYIGHDGLSKTAYMIYVDGNTTFITRKENLPSKIN